MGSTIYPLLFGGDINVYSVARAFHEAYGVRSTCYGKYASSAARFSAIVDYRVCPDNEDPERFRENVTRFAREHQDGTVLVIACGDSYVRLAAGARDWLPENCAAPYPPAELIAHLTDKASFYRLCEQYGISFPRTVVYRPEMGSRFELPFEGPYICKPSDSVAYWAHPFQGNDKVFLLPTREALQQTLDRCYAAGYPGAMIVQERIPGDDSEMRVLTSYSDRRGRVKLMCLGHVLLEEHTPHGLGNHAVIMTESNPALCESFRALLEALGYVGFSNFDLKFDRRDGTYKAFELNCRQGRSNYYVTGAGHNIARYLVEDYLEERELPLTIAEGPSLWRVVPRRVTRDYIREEYHRDMARLEREDKLSNPLIYEGDRGLLRRLWVFRQLHGQIRNFARWYPHAEG